jgi:hypothetical protein
MSNIKAGEKKLTGWDAGGGNWGRPGETLTRRFRRNGRAQLFCS